MKEHEFLDGMNSIDSDVVERFIIMDNQLQEKATVKSKTRGKWLRIVAIAACCSIIVSVALIIVPLLIKEDWFDGFDHLTDTFPGDADIDNDGVGGNKDDVNDNHFPDAPIEQESNAEYDGDGNEPNAPIESEDVNERPDFENPDHYEELPGEDMNEPELVLNINIADERYSGYEIPGYFCDPDSVGGKIGEITIEVGYGFELHPARAELYRVEGIDDDFCLCMRYIDSEDSNALDGVLEPDAYYFLWAKTHSFDSLESVWALKLEEAELNIGSSIGYYKNTNKDYPKNFVLFGGTKKAELVEILLAAKGKSIDAEGGAKVEKVHSEADEIVTLYCNFTSKIGFFHGQIRVYDTGYLYFSTMGGQLFEIGQDVAGDIIYFVTQKCEADGYIRDENGDWRPIGAVEDAKYSTLNEAFDENQGRG